MTNLFLFATMGFFEGMGRVLDLGGTLTFFNESPNPKEADSRALMSDWMTVGQDIKTAVDTYAEEECKKA